MSLRTGIKEIDDIRFVKLKTVPINTEKVITLGDYGGVLAVLKSGNIGTTNSSLVNYCNLITTPSGLNSHLSYIVALHKLKAISKEAYYEYRELWRTKSLEKSAKNKVDEFLRNAERVGYKITYKEKRKLLSKSNIKKLAGTDKV